MMDDARRVFDEVPDEATELFRRMIKLGLQPGEITFVEDLSASYQRMYINSALNLIRRLQGLHDVVHIMYIPEY
jgi:hypothetical protein